MNEQKKYVLQVQRVRESNLQYIENISKEESIMRPSYEQAMRALIRIMQRTKLFHEENENKTADLDDFSLENRLFGYSENIIAFAAPKGGGKTATMQSFSRILNEGFGKNSANKNVNNAFLNVLKEDEEENPEAWLKRCNFILTTPVAPAVLTGTQNILYVVYSRLYRYAERLIVERSRNDRIREAQKNKIIRSSQKVISGIKGIKQPDEKYPGDLASMQDVCDGLSLSRHFYNFVQNILELADGDMGISDRYLVIQLDDADSKSQKVYEVMEDVRKYLMIPNLVILMSVDQKCLSDVVLQDNLSYFPDLLKIDQERLSHDLSKNTNKYIDKLIPPTHMVHLPRIDQVVTQWGDMLRLRYVTKKGKDVYSWMNDEEMDLQTAVLVLIYRKTGILFVKPPHYLHNMIPRTLRGLVQFLSLLDKMEDIPQLDFGTYTDVEAYAKAVLNQSEIAAINQRQFSDYFRTSWMNVKIVDQRDRGFIERFANTVSSNRIRLALEYLRIRYRNDLDEKHFQNIKSRVQLDQLMWKLDRVRRTENDFKLFFAIRTLFTLDSHQHILKRKREAARRYIANPNNKGILIFDLNPTYIWTPTCLWTDGVLNEFDTRGEEARPYRRLMTPLLGTESFRQALYDMSTKTNDITRLQWAIHQVQEIAIALYANSDVSYDVRANLKNYVKNNESDNQLADTPTKIECALIKQISSFNDGKLQSSLINYPTDLASGVFDSWIERIFSLLTKIMNKAKENVDGTSSIVYTPAEDSSLDSTKWHIPMEDSSLDSMKMLIQQLINRLREPDSTAEDETEKDNLLQQNPNPDERPHSDQCKAIHKLDDEK